MPIAEKPTEERRVDKGQKTTRRDSIFISKPKPKTVGLQSRQKTTVSEVPKRGIADCRETDRRKKTENKQQRERY